MTDCPGRLLIEIDDLKAAIHTVIRGVERGRYIQYHVCRRLRTLQMRTKPNEGRSCLHLSLEGSQKGQKAADLPVNGLVDLT